MTLFNHKLALVWAGMLYPTYGLTITFVDVESHPFGFIDKTVSIKLFINSNHPDQRLEAKKELDTLLQIFNIQVPDLSRQPPQVMAATYARLLQRKSWTGWMFGTPPKKLSLLKIVPTHGVSKHHHKHYTNYGFTAAGEINRSKVLTTTYSPKNTWWYASYLQAKPISGFPSDGLLWNSMAGKDRGDIVDANLIASSLGLRNKQLLQAVFYQIKFEMADVICFDTFHGQTTANLPGNIFSRVPALKDSVTGEMIAYFRLHGRRPSVSQIYQAGIEGRLPNHAWTGKWESRSHPHH